MFIDVASTLPAHMSSARGAKREQLALALRRACAHKKKVACFYACTTHVCMYVCKHGMRLCMHACMHVCRYGRYGCMCVCVYVCTYRCMVVCVYVCMYACMCLCMYAGYVSVYLCMSSCFHACANENACLSVPLPTPSYHVLPLNPKPDIVP